MFISLLAVLTIFSGLSISATPVAAAGDTPLPGFTGDATAHNSYVQQRGPIAMKVGDTDFLTFYPDYTSEGLAYYCVDTASPRTDKNYNVTVQNGVSPSTSIYRFLNANSGNFPNSIDVSYKGIGLSNLQPVLTALAADYGDYVSLTEDDYTLATQLAIFMVSGVLPHTGSGTSADYSQLLEESFEYIENKGSDYTVVTANGKSGTDTIEVTKSGLEVPAGTLLTAPKLFAIEMVRVAQFLVDVENGFYDRSQVAVQSTPSDPSFGDVLHIETLPDKTNSTELKVKLTGNAFLYQNSSTMLSQYRDSKGDTYIPYEFASFFPAEMGVTAAALVLEDGSPAQPAFVFQTTADNVRYGIASKTADNAQIYLKLTINKDTYNSYMEGKTSVTLEPQQLSTNLYFFPVNGAYQPVEEGTGNILQKSVITQQLPFIGIPLQVDGVEHIEDRVLFKKTDIAGNPIEGAQFNLYKANASGQKTGDVLATITSDAAGSLAFDTELLQPGNFVLEEIFAPAEYDVCTTLPFTITNDYKLRVNGAIVAEPYGIPNAYNEFNFYKVNEDNEPLTGAKFVLRCEGALVATLQSQTVSGRAKLVPDTTFHWERGKTYTLTETESPTGYVKISPITFSVVDDLEEGTSIKIGNAVYEDEYEIPNSPSLLIITKYSATNPTQKITASETEFKFTGIDNNNVVTESTVNGVLEVSLPAGSYKVTESKAPSGYELADAQTTNFVVTFPAGETPVVSEISDSIHIKANSDYEVNFYDEPNTFVFEKVDRETRDSLAGFTFLISTVSPSGSVTPLTSKTTDEYGFFTLSGLEPGKYQIQETAALTNYSILGGAQMFTVDTQGKLAPSSSVVEGYEYDELLNGFVISDTKTHVEIYKKEGTKPLGGGVYEIYEFGPTTGTPLLTCVADATTGLLTPQDAATGVVGIPDGTLPVGNYLVKEVLPPEGYAINRDTETTAFVVSSNPAENVITLQNAKTSVILTKTDALTKEPVEGAKIEVSYKDASSVKHLVGTYTTGTDGLITLEGLVVGINYSYEEVVAPAGYILDKTVHEFALDKYGSVDATKLAFTNTPIAITITKTNAKTGKPVAGAEYAFYSGSKELGRYKTDSNGRIKLTLSAGTYTYKEVTAPAGYALDTTSYTFTISADGTKSGTFNVKDSESGITIYKKDYTTGKALAGAKFDIKKNGTVVASVESDSKGEAKVQSLEPGTYEIVETKAPAGYVVTDKKYSFVIKDNGAVEGDITVYDKLDGTQPTPTPTPSNGGGTKPDTGSSMLGLYAISTLIGAGVALAYLNKFRPDDN